MATTKPVLIRKYPLPFLLSVPEKSASDRLRPVLIFLHGYQEGPPTEIEAALTIHGPLSPRSSPFARAEFIVGAPQLPIRGDLWGSHAEVVCAVAQYAQEIEGGDPHQTYLTGFSFGGNGVFDVALLYPNLWAALWPVDPTRVPASALGLPVWLSCGAAARPSRRGFIERLHLKAPQFKDQDHVFCDEDLDHVATATSAYGGDTVYRWLLAHHRD